MDILKFSEYFSERNVQIGFLLIVIPTFIVYITTIQLFAGFFLFSDIQFIIGVLIGEIYALKNLTSDQTYLKCGIIVGVFGGVLAAFAVSIWDTVYYFLNFIGFLVVFGNFIITGAIIGLIIGGIMGSFFMYREMKEDTYEEEKRTIDEDFYKDLIED